MSALTVVAWSPGPASAAAVEWALERARSVGGAVELVAVLDDVLAPAASGEVDGPGPVTVRAAVEAAVEQARESSPGVPVSGRVVHGFVVRALARETAMDRLLVIGTRRRRRGRLGYGWSYGAQVAALAHGPVAVVPEGGTGERSGVVVGVDGSPASWEAVLFAADEAERTGRSLRIVHASQERGIPVTDSDVRAILLAEHRRALETVAGRLREARPSARPELVLTEGAPAHALLHAEPAPALVVVGSRGVEGWTRLLLGSVSHDVLAALDAPVVVVGPPERQRAIPAGDAPPSGRADVAAL